MKISHIFNSQTKTVTFAAILIGVSALISGVLGLIRDRLLAGRFGAGQDLDVYFAAFRIPDFVYGILIIGGISTVFLPVLAEFFKKSEEDGWKLVSDVLNCFLVLLIFLCLLLAVFAPFLIHFITPGFSESQKSLAVSLSRIMFLSPIFFGLSSIFSGILHYFNRFLAYSLAPIFYNLSIIFGILYLVPVFGLKGLAYGVILGAFLHWFLQIPAAKISGFRYKITFDFKHPGLLKIFKLMIPRTIGVAGNQINLIVITAIASILTAGSISIFNFSNNLQSLPINLIGVSFALAVFPTLSRAWANGVKEEFLENFSSTFRQILFLVIPTFILMFLLRAQIVRIVLGVGQFGWEETRLTAASLGLFCLGSFSFAFIPFLGRVFYSLQDTKTPVKIGLFSVAFNVLLSFLFVWLFGFTNVFRSFMIDALKLQGIENISVVGLPLALSISGIFQFSLLSAFLRRKMGDIRLGEISRSLMKIIMAGILTAISAYLALQLAANFVDMTTFKGVFSQAVFAGFIGMAVYILFSHLFGSPELKTIKFSILGQFAKPVDKK